MAVGGRETLPWRCLRAARLERQVYDEVAADPHASVQGALVVVLSGVAAGIGSATPGESQFLALQVMGSVAGWLVSAVLVYLIGGRALALPGTHVEFGAALRTIAFANAPGLLRIFGTEASIRSIVFSVTSAWILAASVAAVRAALRFPTIVRAIVVTALAFAAQVALLAAVLGT